MNTNDSPARPSDIQLIVQHLFRIALPGLREGAKSIGPSASLERSEHGRTRSPGFLRRSAATALLLLAGLAPVAAQAQTSTLVSNLGQTDATSNVTVGGSSSYSNSFAMAQQFTTGGNADDYTISGVVVNIRSIIQSPQSRAGV